MDVKVATELAQMVGEEKDSARKVAMLDALTVAAGARKVVPEGGVNWVADWLKEDVPAVAERGAQLVGFWKAESCRPVLEGWLGRSNLGGELRVASMKGLAMLGGESSKSLFDRLFREQKDPASRALMVEGLMQMAPQLAANRAAEYLAEVQAAEQVAPVMGVLLQNKKLPALLAGALEGKKLNTAVAAEAIRMASTRGVTGPLVDALKKAGGVKQMDRALSPEEMAGLVAKVASEGKAHRGEAVYRRKQLLCMTCHAIGDAGGVLGPNLVSIGGSAPVDYLIESLLDPSKKIKEGYHMVMISTKSGQVFSGGLVKDSPSEVVIRDPANQMQTVLKAEIASQQMSPVSMMPAGLTASLREDEFVDLVRFLSELGKEGDFKIGPKRLVRSWQSMGSMDQAAVDHVRHVGLQALNEEAYALPWEPKTSLVSGELPLDELVTAQKMYPWFPRIARFRLNMAEEGEVKLGFSEVKGIVLVVGSEIIKEVSAEMVVKLPAGITAICLLATKESAELKRISLEILEGAAQVQP
jgi:putative heme-binding domain-containing protein